MEHRKAHPARRRAAPLIVVTMSLIAACGGSDATSTAASATSASDASSTTAGGRSTTPPTTANETASTQRPATTAAPVAPTSEPAPTVPAEPVGIRDHLQLTAGWSYHTRNFDVPFGWTMPATDDLGRWGVLFDTGNYVIVTLNLADKERPEVVREEPGFVFSAVPPANDVDEAIALWLAEAETRESFVAEQSTGAFLGTETAVVSGSYEITTPAPGAYFIRLADDFTVPVAPGERRYVSYFVPVGDRVVIVSINGHAVDFDLVVTLAGQILDSLEFA